jgi:hypothetical protein
MVTANTNLTMVSAKRGPTALVVNENGKNSDRAGEVSSARRTTNRKLFYGTTLHII